MESPAGAGLVPLPLRRPHGAPALASKVWVGGASRQQSRPAPPRQAAGMRGIRVRRGPAGFTRPERRSRIPEMPAGAPAATTPHRKEGASPPACGPLGQPQSGQPLLACSTSLDRSVSPERGSEVEVENRGCEGHRRARSFLRSELMSLPSVRGATP